MNTTINPLNRAVKSLKRRVENKLPERKRIAQFPLSSPTPVPESGDAINNATNYAQTVHEYLKLLSEISNSEVMKVVIGDKDWRIKNFSRPETTESTQDRQESISQFRLSSDWKNLSTEFMGAASRLIDFLNEKMAPIISKIEFTAPKKR